MSTSGYDNGTAVSSFDRQFSKMIERMDKDRLNPIETQEDKPLWWDAPVGSYHVTPQARGQWRGATNADTHFPFEQKDDFRFEDFRVDDGNKEAFDAVVNWSWEDRKGLFLFGPSGTGKTFLLKAKIREIATLSKPIWFLPVIDLFNQILQPRPEEKTNVAQMERIVLKKYAEPQGLVIDDVQQIKTDYQNDVFKQLIDSRERNGKSTFLSCDLTSSAVKNQIHSRILDRLKDHCRAVLIRGASKRGTAT